MTELSEIVGLKQIRSAWGADGNGFDGWRTWMTGKRGSSPPFTDPGRTVCEKELKPINKHCPYDNILIKSGEDE